MGCVRNNIKEYFINCFYWAFKNIIIADALGVFEQELFSDNKKKNLKILSKIYSFQSGANYPQLIELLEYLPPKSLECLEEILNLNKERIIELNQLIKNNLNKEN